MRAFIFDEAGTGKTKRSMDLLDDAEHILVICPASVVKTHGCRKSANGHTARP